MIGKIVSLAGIQCGGKTTGVFEFTSELKKQNINAWPVFDIARTTTLPINENGTWLTQEVIAHRMIVAQLEAAAKHEVVVTDRTPLDCLAYNLACGVNEDSLDHQRLKRFIYDYVKTHNTIMFKLSEGFELQDDGTRTMDKSFYNNSIAAFDKVYTEAEIDLELNVVEIVNFYDPAVRKSILHQIMGICGE